MASKTTDVIFPVEIRLKATDIPKITGLVTEPGLSDSQKIQVVARDLMDDVVEGGMMVTGEQLQLIEDSTGIEATKEGIAAVLPFLTEKSGMEDGFHIVKAKIDPAYYAGYEEIAKAQDKTVDEIVQDVFDAVQANEWVYEIHPRPECVLMPPAAKAELEELLGEKFQTGTDLLAACRRALSPSSLFDEVPEEEELVPEPVVSNVGQGE